MLSLQGTKQRANRNRGRPGSRLLAAVSTLLVASLLCVVFVEGFSSSSSQGRVIFPPSSSSSSSSSRRFATNKNDNSDELREKAAALRREVEEFEASKQQEVDALNQKAAAEQQKRQIAVFGDGTVSMERCDFAPRLVAPAGDSDTDTDSNTEPEPISRILALQAPLPLGIVLGQEDYDSSNKSYYKATPPITVDDLAETGNAASAGIRRGDVLRACTACQVTMEQPTWQLLAGGIGRPKTTRMMVGTDDKALEEVLETIASNGMDPEGRNVWLVVERPEDDGTTGVGVDDGEREEEETSSEQ
eukprot:jgi/Psemu1/22528/gm1.22528_g